MAIHPISVWIKVVKQPTDRQTYIAACVAKSRFVPKAYDRHHIVITLPWKLCMFSLLYLNSVWVKIWFIEGQQCSFNIVFKNTIWYLIVCFHVRDCRKIPTMSTLISAAKLTNYSLNISDFNSVPDNIHSLSLASSIHSTCTNLYLPCSWTTSNPTGCFHRASAFVAQSPNKRQQREML